MYILKTSNAQEVENCFLCVALNASCGQHDDLQQAYSMVIGLLEAHLRSPKESHILYFVVWWAPDAHFLNSMPGKVR